VEPPVGPTPSTSALLGLVIDWGGVLTGSLDGAMSDWADRDGVDFEAFRAVIRQWVGRRGSEDVAEDWLAAGTSTPEPPSAAAPATGEQAPATGEQAPATGEQAPATGEQAPATGEQAPATGEQAPATGEQAPVAALEEASDLGPAGTSPLHRLERGEISELEFERELAAELAVRGAFVAPEGLLARLLAGLTELDPRMLDLLRRARTAGLRVALLSNSWGDHYPEQLWQGLFDAIVISGRVGMRKPEPEIFHYAARQLELPVQHCVMVDDLPHNVTAAVGVGMVGVLHRGYDETVGELEALFGVNLH
jgi:HAD superfamily hydrolase (TIGR01509 family)